MTESRTKRGFTLIELMVVVSIIGISIAMLVNVQYQNDKFTESEIMLQRATQALRSEVEVLRSVPYGELKPGEIPFNEDSLELANLVAGRGVVGIDWDAAKPNLLALRVEVHWNDPRIGMRSIHTLLLRAP